ncbi:MAG: DUF6056 family protein [Anaerolineales bacterium]
MVILFGIVLNYIPGFLPNLDKVSSQITKYGLITLENFTQINSYISLVVLYSAFLLSIFLLYLCFDRKIRFISIGIFSLGIITRLTLLLSPTIWASGKRTFFPLSIALIICCVLLFEKLMDLESDQYIKKFLTIIGYVSGVMYLELFMSI